MDPAEYIAVYGSLLRAEGMLVRLGADRFLRFVGSALIPGRLFDLGKFPGLQPAGAAGPVGEAPDPTRHGQAAPPVGTVPGELFEIVDPAALAILDEYEGFDSRAPEQSAFVRQRIRLPELGVEAWVYVYNRPVGSQPMVSGVSWPEYKAGRGR